MFDFKFESATRLNENHLKFITDVLLERGFKNNKVIIEPVGKVGDNYVALVTRIIVERDDGNSFNIIAKIAPSSERVRQTMLAPVMFRNENFMYSKVLPKLLAMQKTAGVPETELFRFPEFYGSYLEAPNEIILLEDLRVNNFAMQDRLKPLSNEYVKLVLTQFAVYHSLSFALKHEEPETFAAFSKQLINMWAIFEQHEEAKGQLGKMEDNLTSIFSDEYKAKIKGTLGQICALSTKEYKYDLESKHSVIQQGDAWTNNILFKSEGDKIVDCIMIDYQLSKCSSPVADFMYFIFNCTDYETRSKRYNEWIDHYFSEMNKNLLNFGLKVNQVYSRDAFDADLRRHGKLALGQAILLNSVLLKESDEIVNVREKENFSPDDIMEANNVDKMKPATKQRFKERVEGIVKSFTDLGYL